MKILTQIRLYLVTTLLAFFGLLINYLNQKDELLKCQTDKGFVEGGDIQKSELIQTIDSFKNEMFIKDIQIGSYEVMWNMLEESHKELADSINLLVE